MTREEKRQRHKRRLQREAERRWRARHPDKMRAKSRRWRVRHPDYRRPGTQTEQQRLRRARRRAKRERDRRRWNAKRGEINAKRRERHATWYPTYRLRKKVLREAARYAALVKASPPKPPSLAVRNAAFLSSLQDRHRCTR